MRTLVMWLIALTLALPVSAETRKDRAANAEAQWQQCVVSFAEALTGRSTPENVTDAAFGRCGEYEDAFRFALMRWSKGPLGRFGKPAAGEELERMMEVERQRIRRVAISAVLVAK